VVFDWQRSLNMIVDACGMTKAGADGCCRIGVTACCFIAMADLDMRGHLEPDNGNQKNSQST